MVQPATPTNATGFSVRVPVGLVKSKAADGKPNLNAIAVWLFCRACDHPDNSDLRYHADATGRATFSWDFAKAFYRRSIPTLRRHLRQAQQRGFLRSVTVRDGMVTVYYSSTAVVARLVGLRDLGAIAHVPLEKINALRYTSTEVIAQHLQSQSRHAARHALKQSGVKRPQLPKPEEIITACENLAREKGVGFARYAFVDEEFTSFGASQEGIARRSGCTIRTAQRHLSNSHRARVNAKGKTELSAIAKRQLAQQQPAHMADLLRLRRAAGCDRELRGELNRLIRRGGKVYRVGVNLYALQYALASSKTRRRRLIDKLDGLIVNTEPSEVGGVLAYESEGKKC